ncbi:uncharacterized protein SOCEGT47_014180 [Sorangium cellulosum]|uniref:DUF7008 domain-containing protein n=1 Tax=Sorangium cellulosum TaxID=56 RepID=A0A4P2PWI6_SORCE|nr:uncharacterized protein SOCEGT47_014180 [Sorangium cellulosum]
MDQRRHEDGWGASQLVPLLAGVLELALWTPSWHRERSRPGSKAQQVLGWLESEMRAIGVSVEELQAWRPSFQESKQRRGPRHS